MADLVPGRHRWGEVLPKEGAAASSSRRAARAPGRGRGSVVLRGRMLVGRIQQNMHRALPGSALQLGVAQQLLNPSQHWILWQSPALGATGAVGYWWVGGQAVGSRKDHVVEKWVWVSGKKQAGSGMSNSWGKRAWIRDEQRKWGSSALHLTGRGRNKVPFGQCFSRMWR